MTDRFEKNKSRKFLGSGHVNRKGLENQLPDDFSPPCLHDRGGYCHKLQLMPKEHCSKDYMKNCGQVKKYYDKYGEAGNHLGVGS